MDDTQILVDTRDKLLWDDIRKKDSKEYANCARLCIENILGLDRDLHPNDYIWNNTQYLPRTAADCDGRTALVIADKEKFVTVYRTSIGGQNADYL